MNVSEKANQTARGHVTAVAGGSVFADVDNTSSISAARVLAMAYAGDSSGVPSHIGFLYGESDADGFSFEAGRDMSVGSIGTEIRGKDMNVQCAKITGRRVEEVDPDDPSKGVSAVFCAVTNSSGVSDMFNEGEYCHGFDKDKYVYQAILLGRGGCPGEWIVLARADLGKNGSYRRKPADYELSVEWKVTFK